MLVVARVTSWLTCRQDTSLVDVSVIESLSVKRDEISFTVNVNALAIVEVYISIPALLVCMDIPFDMRERRESAEVKSSHAIE